MAKVLRSVGIDVGTTTTQMVVSELTVENRANGFTVPRMDITDRHVVYESPVFFTPLAGRDLVDIEKLKLLLQDQYRAAAVDPAQVDTGAVIITGETSRKENARLAVEHLADLAGDFVVATAGPDLESVLAAKGAGAADWSEKTGKQVLHMDIGGGTSNLALIRDGEVVKTGCLNVGGRLIRMENGRIVYLSPVLQGLTRLKVGEIARREQLMEVAELLTRVLEMAAGLMPQDETFTRLTTRGATLWQPEKAQVLSFSGGVADCIREEKPWEEYGDLGPLLGLAISKSRLCAQQYRLGRHTIRATVMGAGCHSAQLSGSTVYCREAKLPQKNLPVVVFRDQSQVTAEQIRSRLGALDGPGVLAMPGWENPDHSRLQALADTIVAGTSHREVYICLQQDMAKALGQVLALKGKNCLCLDRLALQPDSFLDIGKPVGPALPVVIKTLVL